MTLNTMYHRVGGPVVSAFSQLPVILMFSRNPDIWISGLIICGTCRQ
jgi:hypothetical protein